MPNGLFIPKPLTGAIQQGITGLAQIKQAGLAQENIERQQQFQQEQFQVQQGQALAKQEQQGRQEQFARGQEQLKTLRFLAENSVGQTQRDYIGKINEVSDSMGIGFNVDALKVQQDPSFFKDIGVAEKVGKQDPTAGEELFANKLATVQIDEPSGFVSVAEQKRQAEQAAVIAERERRSAEAKAAGLIGERALQFRETGQIPTKAKDIAGEEIIPEEVATAIGIPIGVKLTFNQANKLGYEVPSAKGGAAPALQQNVEYFVKHKLAKDRKDALRMVRELGTMSKEQFLATTYQKMITDPFTSGKKFDKSWEKVQEFANTHWGSEKEPSEGGYLYSPDTGELEQQ